MLTVRDDQMNQMGASGQPPVQPCPRLNWIEFRLVDEDNNPVPSVKYRVKLPDGSIKEGALDTKGGVRFDGITPGQAAISFPELDASEWKPV